MQTLWKVKKAVKKSKARKILNRGPKPTRKLNQQVKAAFSILDKVTKKKKRNGKYVRVSEIQVTGHSLGGFLTQVVTVKRKVRRGIAFNPPGARSYLKVGSKKSNLTNHSRKHDIVGRFGKHVGKHYLYRDVKFKWKKIKKRYLMRNHGIDEFRKELFKGMRPK